MKKYSCVTKSLIGHTRSNAFGLRVQYTRVSMCLCICARVCPLLMYLIIVQADVRFVVTHPLFFKNETAEDGTGRASV